MKGLSEMMKQAQQLQSKMEEMQSKLDELEVEGVSGGGMLKVTLNGNGQMRGVKIDPTLVDPNETEMLEDLIVAAHNDAKIKAEDKMQSEMQSLTGGLSLPPGMKLPF